MACGEGRDLSASKLQKQITTGQFSVVDKLMRNNPASLQLSTVLTVLSSTCTYITTAQKDATLLVDHDGLADVTSFCCSFAAKTNEITEKQKGKDNFKRALQSIHYNMYYLYNKGLFDQMEKICNPILDLSKLFAKVDDIEQRNSLKKIFLELGSIGWNSSFKLTDSKGGPKLSLCLFSFKLFVQTDETQSSTAWDRIVRALISFGKSKQSVKLFLEEMGSSCEPILTAALKNDSFVSHFTATIKTLLNNVDLLGPNVRLDIKLIEDLFPSTCIPLVKTVTRAYLTFGLIINNKHKEDEFEEFKTMLQTDDSGRTSSILIELASRKIVKCDDLSPGSVSSIQEIFHACMINANSADKIDLAYQILVMSNSHVPKTKKNNGWQESCLSSLFWTMEALGVVKDEMCSASTDNFNQRVRLVYRIMVVAWNFYQKANCCYEAYSLNKFFLKYAFKLGDIPNLDREKYESVMHTLTEGAKFVSRSLITKRPGREKEMAKQAVDTCFKTVVYAVKSMKILCKEESEKIVSSAIQVWCDIRMLAAKILNDQSVGLVDYLKSSGQSLDPEALEILLCMEIVAFDQEKDCGELLNVSRQALEVLQNKSGDKMQQLRTKLAISLACSKSESVADVEKSRLVAMQVSEYLVKEVKKAPALDKLIILILALHQEFLSIKKEARLKNKEMADVPLTVRAPSKRDGPEDEQKTCEEWEIAVELSQLGQILSCRQESKELKQLTMMLNYCSEIVKMEISSNDKPSLGPILQAMECVGLHFTITGHEWCAIKCWNIFYLLSKLVESPQHQLRALGWLIQKYNLEDDEKLHNWILQTGSELKKKIEANKSQSVNESFTLRFFDICLAQCYVNSGKPTEAAHIILQQRKEIDHGVNFLSAELMRRTFLIASQVMGCFSKDHPLSKPLAEAFVSNVGSAEWTFKWAVSHISTTKPAERELVDLRLTELMLSSGLWLANLCCMSCCYKKACSTLQSMLYKLQRLHFPTRVAQLLSLLGDLDTMVPDTQQVEQRLFWNRKILNLGTAIAGDAKGAKDLSPATTPSKVMRKEHQLTAWCSPKCQGSSGCILCKNPLYQICKAHYLFLSATNKETFWTLFSELEKANAVRSQRLSSLAWSNMHSPAIKTGWLQMLQGPIDLLKHRLILSDAPKLAAKTGNENFALRALREVLVCSAQIRRLKMPIARYLENWAVAEEVAIGIQLLRMGPWSTELQTKSYTLAPEYKSEEETSRPCSPTPNIVIPTKPPKPQRRGRKALIAEPEYIAPPNPQKVEIIDLVEESPERVKIAAAPKMTFKTCKKPFVEDRHKENSPKPFDDDSPILPFRSTRRQLIKPVAEVTSSQSTTPKETGPGRDTVFTTAVKKPPSNFSSSSNDSHGSVKPKKVVAKTRVTREVKTKAKPPVVLPDEAPKRRVKRSSSTSSDDIFVNTRTRKR
ncbi:uncharacterized protein LOC132199133 [Neocloeon triangulifer]|uniref:uncharacterized protein LOC132199133 n=1 Tax=Neocloeon triangulifer TaxID=2078957 RepID=UPI00286EF95A|nr:uncharacterized protein LOC132199133 [Neocloeon triangulifer]